MVGSSGPSYARSSKGCRLGAFASASMTSDLRVPPAYPRSAIQGISAISATRETLEIQGFRSSLADSLAFTPWMSSVRAR